MPRLSGPKMKRIEDDGEIHVDNSTERSSSKKQMRPKRVQTDVPIKCSLVLCVMWKIDTQVDDIFDGIFLWPMRTSEVFDSMETFDAHNFASITC